MTYATSLHSQKSETSSKSARSYFSLASVPSLKPSLWKNLKTWVMLRPRTSSPTESPTASTLARDNESITTTLTSSSCTATTATTIQAASESPPLASTTRYKASKGILVKARRRQRVERVTFREPSPVPRFRNVAPPPPPSPPYLEIFVRPDRPQQTSAIIDDTTVLVQKGSVVAAAAAADDDDVSSSMYLPMSRKLSFASPWHRGQTLFFTLFNALPDEHIIVFKFLTSNTKLTSSTASISSKRSSISSMMTNTTTATTNAGNQERYFVRPSTGKTTDRTEVMLFLNQVPEESPRNSSGKISFKDKIIVRWAIVQRHTQVEAWVLALPESMRRKWLEMLVDRWADQIVVRETRLKIRFLQ